MIGGGSAESRRARLRKTAFQVSDKFPLGRRGRLGGAGFGARAHNTRIWVSDKFAGAGHGGDNPAGAGWLGTDGGRRLGPALVKEHRERSRNMIQNEGKSPLGGGVAGPGVPAGCGKLPSGFDGPARVARDPAGPAGSRPPQAWPGSLHNAPRPADHRDGAGAEREGGDAGFGDPGLWRGGVRGGGGVLRLSIYALHQAGWCGAWCKHQTRQQ